MIRFLLNLETFHDFRLQGRKKKINICSQWVMHKIENINDKNRFANFENNK